MPGCPHAGEYRAPKSRAQLNDYWWFCLEHVRAYNAAWDFYRGMSPAEIEAEYQSLARALGGADGRPAGGSADLGEP